MAPGDDGRADVHGFHVYPARMHPRVAAAIVATWSKPGERLLDPFCGSGTLLCEAIAAGRKAVGVDLNPLAVRLAGWKARPWTAARAAVLVAQARAVAWRAATARHGAPRGENEWFEPHVLKELAALRGEIRAEPAGEPKEGLELLLSSILVKLSRQASDTRLDKTRKQIARGFATRLFVRKADELAVRLGAFGARVARDAEAAQGIVGDARRLDALGIGASTIALCATSPPYGGAFDYLGQHERRARWLGLDLAPLSRGEIGARRTEGGEFAGDMSRALLSIARTLRPGGRLVLITGDDLEVLAARAGLRFVAAATQPRPHGRREHLMLMEKPA